MLQDLLNVIRGCGFNYKGFYQQDIILELAFRSRTAGKLAYEVSIGVEGGSSNLNELKFIRCVLKGPVINARQLRCVRSESIGEWKTLNGAIKGFKAKFTSAKNQFSIGEQRCVNTLQKAAESAKAAVQKAAVGKKRICSLERDKAVAAIKGAKEVYYKHGVWNEYQKVPVSTAIAGIQKSGYGADVDYNEQTKDYFVSVPSDGDMF